MICLLIVRSSRLAGSSLTWAELFVYFEEDPAWIESPGPLNFTYLPTQA